MRKIHFIIGFLLGITASFSFMFIHKEIVESFRDKNSKIFLHEEMKAELLKGTSGKGKIILKEKNKAIHEDLKIDLPKSYENIAKEIILELPSTHTFPLKKIVAEYGENVRRGLASFKSMYLGVDVIKNEQEFRRVFIHEMGHIVDLGALKAKEKKDGSGFRDGSNIIYETDPSLDFYRLCWEDEYTQNGECDNLDFVSEYSETDAFEDFAESYLLFFENNKSFKSMASKSKAIAKKYDFFANVVFNGNFKKTPKGNLPEDERVWDLTQVY